MRGTRGREVGRLRAAGGGPRHADFHEELYEALRATPWWLASAGGHAVAFLLLSALLGGPQAARAEERVEGRIEEPEVALEEPIQPDVPRLAPIDVREDAPPPDMEVLEDPVEAPAAEPDELPGDPRLTPGPFEGTGGNTSIGVGSGAAGGGGFPPFASGRLLKEKVERKTLDATYAGLDWLFRHQGPLGSWDGDGFESRCRGNPCGGAGGPIHDTGLTGLSLLAFLGAGETHKGGPYAATVRGGLRWLKGVQDAEGCFGPRTSGSFVYDHAIATLAMAEAYGMTGSFLFRSSAQNGVDFVHRCQNPYLAWRYGVRPQDNDTSVTGWMVMALKSAASSGLRVDPAAFDGARAWLDKVTEPEYGRAGYTARGNGPARPQELMDKFPADKSESLTAVAVLTRIFCGEATGDEMVRKGADLCARSLPTWDEAAGTIDFYYWYYGTLAMYQVGGPRWERWNDAMTTSIVAHLRKDASDCRRGSWDPVDPWSGEGGRVYATALNTLSLEVYYRYPRVFGVK